MQTIYLDISKKQLIPTLYAKQGDVGRKFKAVITNNGSAYALDGELFSAGYEGASGSGNYKEIYGRGAFELEKGSNVVIVELAPNMFKAHGDSLFCLTMENQDGAIISLWNIPVSTEKTPGFLSDEIENYYPELHAVLYTEQTLTETKKDQARRNIGSASVEDLHQIDDAIRDLNDSASKSVKFTSQSLTEEQKKNARENINALKVPQKEVVSKTIQRELVLSDFGSTELEGSGVVSRDISITPRLEFLNEISGFDFEVEISLNGEYYKLTKDDCTVSGTETNGYLQWNVANTDFGEYVFTINQFDGSTQILLNYNPTDFNLKIYEIKIEFADAPVVTSVNDIAPDKNGNLEIPAVLYGRQDLTEDQKANARQNIGAADGNAVFVRADQDQALTHKQMEIARYNINVASTDQVVRIDKSQKLSEEQKAQARANIGVPADAEVKPLVVEMMADFHWACNTEVAAFNASGAYIDPVSGTPNNAFFKVKGTKGDGYVTVLSGGNAEISTIASVTSTAPFAAVLKYGDGTYEVCNAWYRDASTISVYPKLKKSISSGELGNLKTGIHLSRRGYEAYAQKLYRTNPKWCEKGSLIAGYRPTQGATEETVPFTLYGATGGTVHKLTTLGAAFNAKAFTYALLPTFYRFAGANYATETETGIEWSVDVGNKNGYLELFIGGVDYLNYEYEADNPVYIDLYLDGKLHKQVVKSTQIIERVCIDFAGANTALLKIYMKKWNNPDYGFAISAISFWENKMRFADTTALVPKFSTVAQMFDSWGEFHDYQTAKTLEALHNKRCGITVPYENHSKGSQTTVWGKAWFYENVLKYHPSHMLIDFFINDFNSEDGLSETTIQGPDGKEYVNKVSLTEYAQNVQDLVDMAIVNGIQPIFVGSPLKVGITYAVDTEPRYTSVWHMNTVDNLR